MMVPSMHVDLANDPVTDDIVEQLRDQALRALWGPNEEGKQTPAVDHIVATLAHLVNKGRPKRKSVVITLGATQSPVDDVRFIQNTSSGSTGWALADHLHKHGHDVTCVAGLTTAPAPSWLPLVLSCPTPDSMSRVLRP